MTKKPFKASNGWTVQKMNDNNVLMRASEEYGSLMRCFGPDTLETLREYFQHERDQELGRVRWPEDPDYVIYREPKYDYDEDGRGVRVLHEPSSSIARVWERWPADPVSTSDLAGRWYFTEGPGREPERPWEDAQAGEVWRLTLDWEEGTFLVCEVILGKPYFLGQESTFYINDVRITAGRKLLEADGNPTDD